ncbi:MAG: DUF5678 domain-containing protein [Nitrososphaerales archaeon]
MKSEYEYIMSISDELGDYVGQWIAVVDNEIVAKGDNAKDVYEKAKAKYPEREPFIMKVPKESIMLL